MSDNNSETPPPKKGKKRLILIVAGALLVLGGGGGAAWYFMKPAAVGGAEQAAAHRNKTPTYSTLDPFTVNLADPGGERFVQLSVVLEMGDSAASNKVTENIPAVRNAILMLLSTKTSQELLTLEGKTQLADEIAAAAGAQLGWRAPLQAPADAAAPPSAQQTSARAADDAKAPAATGGRPAAKGAPNPVQGVNFVQFIVQ
jgi:flagellar FliL protein